MKIRDLTKPLYEKLYGKFDSPRTAWSPEESVKVFINPTARELMSIVDDGMTRMFLTSEGAFAWGMSPIHYVMAKELGVGMYAIPLLLFTDGKIADARVTDHAEKTAWDNSPNVANAIRNHPYMRKMFPNIGIDYHNDAIVGDWEEL